MQVEPIKLPRWLAPLICTVIAGISSVLYTDHNASIEMRSELNHIHKVLDETRKDNWRLRKDVEEMKAERSDFHEKALSGINELVEMSHRRERRR